MSIHALQLAFLELAIDNSNFLSTILSLLSDESEPGRTDFSPSVCPGIKS